MNLISILLLSSVLAADALGPGDHTRTLEHGGRTRSYIVHVPPKYDAKQPTPVVLIFHGGGSNAEQTVRFTGLNEKADKEGFIAVYPNGTGRFERMLTWNGGNCCAYAVLNKVDDVGFARAMLDDLAKVINLDANRVFATGISNGGIMCYRLASELSDRIAAIASVAGTMGTKTCNPKRPVPIMHFHGTEDKFLPFKGGIGEKSIAQLVFVSVDQTIQTWVKTNGCPEKPVVTDEPNKADDGTSVQRKTFGPGKDGSEVVLFVINRGGHTWPGRDPRVEFLGKSTKNISANDVMWEFFKKHPIPTPKAAEEKLSIKVWNRQGPLGDTPKHVTDAYPLSDQENKGKWVKFEPMTDEFEGKELDRSKWTVGMAWWKGRQPALFSEKNVTVSDGKLHLTMRKEKLPPEAEKLGYHDYSSAALHTKVRSTYGYYEVKAKPMNSGGSSSFWFHKSDTPGWQSEIDVFEIGGKAKGFENKVNITVHVWETPKEKKHWQVGGAWIAPWRLADDYHVYGFDWGKDELKFYVDGVLVRTVENTHWHQPLLLTFDSETMPDWMGMPKDEDLPSTFSVEYVRTWKRK